MRLVIVSHTPHHRGEGGRLVGWGPTVREIDQLATLFDEIVHVAPVHEGEAPPSALPYHAANVRVREVPAAGGRGWAAKARVLFAVPAYAAAITSELRRADVVHVRCPSNIGLVALLLLALRRRPARRWIKYAGNWSPRERESWSYGLQRRLLRGRLLRALVTVNGSWSDQPVHVRAFYNPCLTETELAEGRAAGARKSLASPLRLLFVGRLEEEKGVGRALEVVSGLAARGIDARLDLVGDGEDGARERFESRARELGIAERVRFLGWQPRTALSPLYASSHFLLLPTTCSEGWPKVLSEGMAFGVVPIASGVSSIPEILGSLGTGVVVEDGGPPAFVEAVAGYRSSPGRWLEESRRAVDAAERFTYRNYLRAVQELLSLESA
jgi:glycosyltransferase involved in cell wall biosynthesis